MLMAKSFFNNSSNASEPRLLAVGGIHVFESQAACKLVSTSPEGAVRELGWPDTLAVEAACEGGAEVTCGGEKIMLKIASPARLEIRLVSEGKPTDIPVDEPFRVQALLYDIQGRELEVGKFTHFEWLPSEILEPANDRSAGEFGFCDTCFGLHNFRAVKPGTGSITARLGGLEGKLLIEAKH
jgi:hypothetical protein